VDSPSISALPSIVADKLYKGLRQEFNFGATFMVLDAARRKAMKVKHSKE